MTSDGLVTLERSLVTSVVARDLFTVNEVELFKAVDHWASEEYQQQRIIPNSKEKRRLLGGEIVSSKDKDLQFFFNTGFCKRVILHPTKFKQV